MRFPSTGADSMGAEKIPLSNRSNGSPRCFSLTSITCVQYTLPATPRQPVIDYKCRRPFADLVLPFSALEDAARTDVVLIPLSQRVVEQPLRQLHTRAAREPNTQIEGLPSSETLSLGIQRPVPFQLDLLATGSVRSGIPGKTSRCDSLKMQRPSSALCQPRLPESLH
jgi:hypothetical protein